MKKRYISLIISSALFSNASFSSPAHPAIAYVVGETPPNFADTSNAMAASGADIFLLADGWWYGDKGKVTAEWLPERFSPLQKETDKWGWNYLTWTQFKLAHPEKKMVLSFNNRLEHRLWDLIATDESRENIAQNLTALLTTPVPVYQKGLKLNQIEGGCLNYRTGGECDTSHYQRAGTVYFDGIAFDFDNKDRRATELENENLLKLSQRVRELLGPSGNKLIILSASSYAADPVGCNDIRVSEKCSAAGELRADRHGEALTLLTKGKDVYDYFIVKPFANFKYEVAMANFARAVGGEKKVILGTAQYSQISPQDYRNEPQELNNARAVWQAENNYGGFAFWQLDYLSKSRTAWQASYLKNMKAAADSVRPPADTTAPSAPGALQAAAEAKEKTIYLSWQPAQDDTGVTRYRIYRNGVNIDSVSITRWQDTQALPGTKYEYAIVAVDAAGNISSSSNKVTAELPLEQSHEKPQPPAGLNVAAVTQTTLDIRWQPVHNVAVSQYMVYRDGHKVQSADALSFHDHGLTASTAYTYSVVAQSVTGDLSELSMPLRAVTLADPATQPPAIAAWETDVAYEAGDMVIYNSKKYQCLQRHSAIEDWNPEAAQALWKAVK